MPRFQLNIIYIVLGVNCTTCEGQSNELRRYRALYDGDYFTVPSHFAQTEIADDQSICIVIDHYLNRISFVHLRQDNYSLCTRYFPLAPTFDLEAIIKNPGDTLDYLSPLTYVDHTLSPL